MYRTAVASAGSWCAGRRRGISFAASRGGHGAQQKIKCTYSLESRIRQYRSGCQVVEGGQGISRTAVASAGSWCAGRMRRISSAASRGGYGACYKTHLLT